MIRYYNIMNNTFLQNCVPPYAMMVKKQIVEINAMDPYFAFCPNAAMAMDSYETFPLAVLPLEGLDGFDDM